MMGGRVGKADDLLAFSREVTLLDKPIFRSKRFISALMGLLVMILVAYVPELAPLEASVAKYASDVVIALIAGYSVTDIALEYLRGRTPN